jgi:hypothetical protein
VKVLGLLEESLSKPTPVTLRISENPSILHSFDSSVHISKIFRQDKEKELLIKTAE